MSHLQAQTICMYKMNGKSRIYDDFYRRFHFIEDFSWFRFSILKY